MKTAASLKAIVTLALLSSAVAPSLAQTASLPPTCPEMVLQAPACSAVIVEAPCASVCLPEQVCVRDRSFLTDFPTCNLDSGPAGRMTPPPCRGIGPALGALKDTVAGMAAAVFGGCHFNACKRNFPFGSGSASPMYSDLGNRWY